MRWGIARSQRSVLVPDNPGRGAKPRAACRLLHTPDRLCVSGHMPPFSCLHRRAHPPPCLPQIPILRLLLNNWMGLAVHILYMAW